LAKCYYFPGIVSDESALKVAWQAVTEASWENKKCPLQAYGQSSLKRVQVYHFFIFYNKGGFL
jgi:hypothetical protein